MWSSREKCRDIHWPFANYITNKGQMDPLKGDALCRTLLMHLIRLCMKYVLIRMIFYYSILYMFYVEWIYDVLLFSLQMRSIAWFIHAANVFLLFSLLFWVIAKEDNFDNGKTTSFYSFMIKTSSRIQISIATYLFAV